MKNNELRIGNWVMNALDKPVKVEALGYNILNPGHESGFAPEYKYLKGIPLTPEILEKAGFIKIAYFSDRFSWENDKYLISLNGWFQQKIGSASAVILSENIQYVHELQNLYFVLTSTELEINL